LSLPPDEKGLDYFGDVPMEYSTGERVLVTEVHSREQKAVYTASKEIVA